MGEHRVADFDFEYPESAVAQAPADRREDARLLLVPRGGGALEDGGIRDLPSRLRAGDLVVVNDVAVTRARLSGRRRTGGRVSILVLEAERRSANVLMGARRPLRAGEDVQVGPALWRVVRVHGEGRYDVEVLEGADVAQLVSDFGRMPLPPYIRREAEIDPRDELDRERYQTVFARGGRAVAAPTAGLHFTPELLAAVEARGARLGRLRLDVGAGTFLPMRGDTLDEHVMHEERYEIPADLAQAFAEARRVVAIGTTVARALESAVDAQGDLRPGPASTRLFMRPGHRFAAVDALLTNFHQPRSTLLVLVAAFAGLETVHAAYRHAIERGYRLFSYGDAMFLS